MNEEVWKSIPNYEGLYEVSSLGRVKSLGNDKRCYISKERILKISKGNRGYLVVGLYKDKTRKVKTVHSLVAKSFLNHNPCRMDLVIDHINDNKTDNRVENLQIVTQRFNTKKTPKEHYSSQYKGVSWHKSNNKWRVSIKINGKRINLGYFNCEKEASEKYQTALKTIEI